MFTGIIESLGTVESVQNVGGDVRLRIGTDLNISNIHLKPVAGQGLTEVTEVFLLQRLHQLQHFGFGVRAFQRQALFVQHAAEQGAVEQAEGSAWLFVPERLSLTEVEVL